MRDVVKLQSGRAVWVEDSTENVSGQGREMERMNGGRGQGTYCVSGKPYGSVFRVGVQGGVFRHVRQVRGLSLQGGKEAGRAQRRTASAFKDPST